MRILAVKLFGEKNPTATISSNLDGTFSVHTEDKEFQSFINDLVKQISTDNPQLPLMSGAAATTGKYKLDTTVLKHISNKDPDYLTALGEYFSIKQIEYKGTRLRAYTANED